MVLVECDAILTQSASHCISLGFQIKMVSIQEQNSVIFLVIIIMGLDYNSMFPDKSTLGYGHIKEQQNPQQMPKQTWSKQGKIIICKL